MYFLLNMGIFQPAMLVLPSVNGLGNPGRLTLMTPKKTNVGLKKTSFKLRPDV